MTQAAFDPAWSPSVGTIDLVGLVLIGLLVALGAWRGLWWQVIRLLGVILAVGVARLLAPAGAEWIATRWPELTPRLGHGVAWVTIFVLALGAASLLGLLGQRILEVMQLGLVNRLGGGLAGALTGFFCHLALLVVVCQLTPESFVEEHVAGTYSEGLVDVAGRRWRVVLGAEAASEVDRVLQAAPRPARPSPAPGSGGSDTPGAPGPETRSEGTGLEPGAITPQAEARPRTGVVR